MLTKKMEIIETAKRLFAYQGYDATSTRQIIKEAGISDPLLYYHFKGKDTLFVHVVTAAFDAYFSRVVCLPQQTRRQFEKIENLIAMHFAFAREMPAEAHLIFITCPARFNDPRQVCNRNIQKQRRMLAAYLLDCLKGGVAAGEFASVPIQSTANLIVGAISGMLRQRALKLGATKGMERAAVAFCRRSLLGKRRRKAP